MNLLKKSIKLKLQASFLVLIILSLAGGAISYKILRDVISFQEAKSETDKLINLLADARKYEKDFILYGRKEVSFLRDNNSSSVYLHKQAVDSLREMLEKTANDPVIVNAGLDHELTVIKNAVNAYNYAFGSLVELYKQRGFKDYGLEGQMRGLVHALQECKAKEEQLYALTLRRHEKDYFLRSDLKYKDKLNGTVQEFQQFVQESGMDHMTEDYRKKTIADIEAYRKHFLRIVAIEQKIGLTEQEGVLGEMNQQAGIVEPFVNIMQKKINDKSAELTGNSFLVLLVSSAFMLAFAAALGVVLNRQLTRPVILLDKVIRKVMKGDETALNLLDGVNRQDEIGGLISNFTEMITDNQGKVREISHKNMELQAASRKEKERSWITTGIARFERIVMQHHNDLETLSDEFLLQLVKYTNSSQAALFIRQESEEEGHEMMQLVSCYAGDKKRFPEAEFMYGEGIIGAVWREGEPVYINDVPESYSKIRSGLGQAKPRSLFIVPVVTDQQQVEGVIEIASLYEYSEKEKELIVQAGKGLATSIATARMQKQTNSLLEQATTLAESLRANEDFLRKNMEELQNTQMEMEDKTCYLENQNHLLQKQLSVYDLLVSKVYNGIILVDENNCIAFLNSFAVNFLGRDAEDLTGKNADEILKVSVSSKIKNLKGDPQFVFNGVSSETILKVVSPAGTDSRLRMVIVKMGEADGFSYGLLFNHYDTSEMKVRLTGSLSTAV